MKLPDKVLCALIEEAENLNFGKITLEITFHDGQTKFRIIKETSIVPGKPMSGSH